MRLKFLKLALTVSLCVSASFLPGWAGEDIAKARKLIESGKLEESLQFLKKALGEDENNVEVLTLLCRALNTEDGYKEALGYGEKAVAADSDNSEAHLRLAQVHASQLQYGNMFAGYQAAKDFREHIRKAVSLDPKNEEAWDLEIEFYENAVKPLGGDADHAWELIQQMEEHLPAASLHKQGQKYIVDNDGAKAHKLYTELLKIDPQSARGLFWRSRALRMLGREGEAEKDLLAIRKEDDLTYYYQARYQLARLRVVQKRDIDEAITMFTAFIENAPEGASPSKSAACWRLGTAYELKKDWKGAVEAYERAQTFEPVYERVADSLKKARKKAK